MASASSRIAQLPTVAEMQATRRAIPKYAIPTRLDTKTAKDVDEKKLEEAFKKTVWKRDKAHCRHCKRKVVKSLELIPTRGEVNHIAGRVDRAVRWDRRNGILLCARCHQMFTQHTLLIIGTAKQLFRVGTKSYLNADKKLQFKVAQEATPDAKTP